MSKRFLVFGLQSCEAARHQPNWFRLCLLLVLAVLLSSPAAFAANEGLADEIKIINEQDVKKINFVSDDFIEQQFQENEKVSVIIMQKPGKNGNAIKTFEFQSNNKNSPLDEFLNCNRTEVRGFNQCDSNTVKFGAQTFSKQEIEVKTRFSTFNGFSAEITKETYEKLKTDNDILVEYNYPMHAFLQDSTKLVNATRAWAATSAGLNITGRGETICILDTGLNYSHADFGSCSASDFTNGNCAKAPAGWDYVGNDNNPYDDNGHGTHVAGIAVASGGIRGVAPDAKVIPIKVLDSNGDGNSANILSGIEWCINNATKFNISIISMSLGVNCAIIPGGCYTNFCDSDNADFSSVINNATARNITVTVATGNNGFNTKISLPSCIENATSVGSATKSDALSSFGNRNNITDLLAPGGTSVNTGTCSPGSMDANRICSTAHTGAYISESGTSMATPHVAGAVALLQQFAKLELNRNFTANETQTYLQNSGKTISENGINYKKIDIIQTLVSLDTKAPSLALSTPSNGSVIVAGELVTFNISDNILLDKISYNTNNGANTTLAASSINTTGWPAGSINLSVFVNDSAGNLNWSLYYFSANNSAPTISNLNLTPATVYTNDTLRCNYTYFDANNDAENGTLIQWFIGGAENTTLQNLTTANASFTEKGQVWLCSVMPKDGSLYGNQTNSTNITIQNFPLIVNYTTLSAGKFSGNLTINATMFDIDANDIDVVNFYYQNSTQTTFIANDTASPYSITWNTSTAGDGNYTIIINATDSDANANLTIQNIYVNNINLAPTVTVTAPNGGESWSGTKTITWSASDADYDILSFMIYYSQDGGASWTSLGSASETSFSWDTATMSNGAAYRINVTTTDGAFNISDISNSNFTISNSADNSGGSGGGGGDVGGGLAGSSKPDPNRASFLFPEIKAGQSQSLSVSGKSAIPITEVEFTTSSDLVNGKVIVKKSDGAGGKPASEVYSYVEIETENLENKISSAKINFKIDAAWLKTNSVDKNTIALYRLAGGSWQKLETILIANDGIYARYTAKSPGFSTFGIAGEKLKEQKEFSVQENAGDGKTSEQPTANSQQQAAGLTGFAAFTGRITKTPVIYVVVLALVLLPAILFVKFRFSRRKNAKKNFSVQDYYAEYARRMRGWAAYYRNAQRYRAMGPPVRRPAKARRFNLDTAKFREKVQHVMKWMFTDTKISKQQAKEEKSKVKDRPDFGF